MHYAHQTIVLIHVLAATVCLLVMWVPLFSKKGGKVHRRAGRVFVNAMAVTCLTAFAACGVRIASQPDDYDSPLFLILVGTLAAVSTLWGARILRQKGRTQPHRGRLEWAASTLLVLVGAAAIVYWMTGATLLFVIFGVLCMWVGAGFIQVLRQPPKSKMFWWYEHLGGMLVGCISAVTAFFVVNYAYAPALLRDVIPGVVVWVAPGVIGGVAIAALTHHYKRKFEPKQADA